MGQDLHAILAKGEATPTIWFAVDGDGALEADTHAAQGTTGFVADAKAETGNAGPGHRDCHHAATGQADRLAIHFDSYAVRHG